MARVLTTEQKGRIKRGQDWKCKKCGKSIKNSGHIHHKDGNPENDKIGNLIALCSKCHKEVRHTKGKKKEPLTKGAAQTKGAVGLLIGHAVNSKVDNCHAEGKIIIKGKPESVDVGGLIGNIENTEVANSSADAEIEYEQV